VIKSNNDQPKNFRKCVSDYRNQTDWFAFMDNDEFFVFPHTSPIFSACQSCGCDDAALRLPLTAHTLALFLRQVPSSVGRLYVRAVRFGANGWSRPSPYHVERQETGRPYLAPKVLELVTELHTARGPHNRLDGFGAWGKQRFSPEFRTICNETTSQIKDITQRVCGHGLGKSLLRAGYAWLGPDRDVNKDPGRFIHRFPTDPDRVPFEDFTPMYVLRLHHYSLRNFEEADPKQVWKHLATSKARRVQADAFFNTLNDTEALCYGHRLRQRMSSLQDAQSAE